MKRVNQWEGGRPACFFELPAWPMVAGSGERKQTAYKLTLAEGGAAFLIHHPAGNHSLAWESAFAPPSQGSLQAP